jgi:DNA-directed RNA polymerase
MRLTKSSGDIHRHYSLFVKDHYLMSSKNRRSIINLPAKLPMVCPPKPYDKDTLGGYLLNDEKFSENLLIDKKAYAKNSEFSGDKIYCMVNNISRIPFKINKTLLDYINNEGNKHNLLMDPDARHKFEDLEKRNKYPRGILASYKSKIILQQTILGLADFFSSFSYIYFPVRMDQRGRVYCTPSYLNYQANELSKALLLFAEPGFVDRNDSIAISYLKIYAANCFAGIISRASISDKAKWLDKNIANIVDYDNGILLNLAKDKLLFLSFCMEYKRFHEFYINTSFRHLKLISLLNYIMIKIVN